MKDCSSRATLLPYPIRSRLKGKNQKRSIPKTRRSLPERAVAFQRIFRSHKKSFGFCSSFASFVLGAWFERICASPSTCERCRPSIGQSGNSFIPCNFSFTASEADFRSLLQRQKPFPATRQKPMVDVCSKMCS